MKSMYSRPSTSRTRQPSAEAKKLRKPSGSRAAFRWPTCRRERPAGPLRAAWHPLSPFRYSAGGSSRSLSGLQRCLRSCRRLYWIAGNSGQLPTSSGLVAFALAQHQRIVDMPRPCRPPRRWFGVTVERSSPHAFTVLASFSIAGFLRSRPSRKARCRGSRQTGIAAGHCYRICGRTHHSHRIFLDELPALRSLRPECVPDVAIEIYRYRQSAFRVSGISARHQGRRRVDTGALHRQRRL